MNLSTVKTALLTASNAIEPVAHATLEQGSFEALFEIMNLATHIQYRADFLRMKANLELHELTGKPIKLIVERGTATISDDAAEQLQSISRSGQSA